MTDRFKIIDQFIQKYNVKSKPHIWGPHLVIPSDKDTACLSYPNYLLEQFCETLLACKYNTAVKPYGVYSSMTAPLILCGNCKM